MSNKGKIYVVLTALAILLIVVLEANKPEELNWFPSYAKHHKIPFGTFIFHEQMERMFSKETVVDVERPPFEYLNTNSISGSYVFINDRVTIDEAELNKLLDWTTKGNTLFIASQTMNQKLLDTLNLEQVLKSNFDNFNNRFALQLQDKDLKGKAPYAFNKVNFMYYFKAAHADTTEVIGVFNSASEEHVDLKESYTNIIKHPFGDGVIILSTFPQAFTNYFILEEPNHKYTAGVLSYLNPSKPIYLDNHYKSGKKISSSPLYVFFKAKQLKWAYYMALIAALFYVLFEGKRKQRAVPVVEPLQNQTLAFTRTIANMYYENGKHIDIAQHKIEHFLEYIRSHLHLSTNTIDMTFIEHLAARSNNTVEDTQVLFNMIETILNRETIKTEVLEKLNASIEKFKSNNTWKNNI